MIEVEVAFTVPLRVYACLLNIKHLLWTSHSTSPCSLQEKNEKPLFACIYAQARMREVFGKGFHGEGEA